LIQQLRPLGGGCQRMFNTKWQLRFPGWSAVVRLAGAWPRRACPAGC